MESCVFEIVCSTRVDWGCVVDIGSYSVKNELVHYIIGSQLTVESLV